MVISFKNDFKFISLFDDFEDIFNKCLKEI